jgi:hypothetical protein
MSKIQKETLQKMVKAIAATRDAEYDCGLCIEQLEKFVELEFDGHKSADTYPLVKHHLDSCVGCGDEYKALLDALNNIEAPAL